MGFGVKACFDAVVVVIQSLSGIWRFAILWTAACQASLSFTVSRSLLSLMSIESMMPSKHFILCHPVLLLPPRPPQRARCSLASPHPPPVFSVSSRLLPRVCAGPPHLHTGLGLCCNTGLIPGARLGSTSAELPEEAHSPHSWIGEELGRGRGALCTTEQLNTHTWHTAVN